MNKKQARDQMVALLYKTEAGHLYRQDNPITLQDLPSLGIFNRFKAELANKKISRTSVYKSLEVKCCFGFPKDSCEQHLKNIHDFVYQHLDKNN